MDHSSLDSLGPFLRSRPRRLRRNAEIRDLVQETRPLKSDLIAPLFVMPGKGLKAQIPSMPGQFRFSLDLLLPEVQRLWDLGLTCIALFPALDDGMKNSQATEATNPKGTYPSAISAIKKAVPKMLVMADVALDPYSGHGHDGLVDPATGVILNDPTLEILGKMALIFARAGADIIGPSDMMDGRVGMIRNFLDQHSFQETLIMSYTAKYASAFYGPFRDALNSAPKGDKKSYQMAPANRREALKEAAFDTQEGADFLMVKPALAYLDIISDLKRSSYLPIAAYNVSGEYAMVKAAGLKGWVDNDAMVLEILTSIKRAGADIILSYFAAEAALLLG